MFKGYDSPLGAALRYVLRTTQGPAHLEEIEMRTLSARFCERIKG